MCVCGVLCVWLVLTQVVSAIFFFVSCGTMIEHCEKNCSGKRWEGYLFNNEDSISHVTWSFLVFTRERVDLFGLGLFFHKEKGKRFNSERKKKKGGERGLGKKENGGNGEKLGVGCWLVFLFFKLATAQSTTK